MKCSARVAWLLPLFLAAHILATARPSAPTRGLAAPTVHHDVQNEQSLTPYVNPFMGTNGGGQTFPGADTPFGMVQWSPDTTHGGPGGYLYSDTAIKGFSLTHLSGAGCFNSRDIPFMPVDGSVSSSPAPDMASYATGFSHANEHASPGYYDVQLDSGIGVRLTTTSRTGFGLFTYPAAATATLLIDTGGSANGNSDANIQIIGGDEVTGAATSGHFCGASNSYTVYFAARFDHPFASYGTWSGSTISVSSTTSSGAQSGAYVSFDTTQALTVAVKVGVSFVSAQNALLNLQAEDPGWDFDVVRASAATAWNDLLNRVDVQGGSIQETQTFYTSLYHSLLHPNIFSDINGQYIGFDNQIHAAQGYIHYANYSGWDIYRCEIPLLAVLLPQQTGDMIQSMVNDEQQGGVLPKWAQNNAETGVMIGEPADPIIADAYAFGATNFDTRGALQAMLAGATRTRPALDEYLSLGYVDLWKLYAAAATTLEYTTDDFAIAQFAQSLDDSATHSAFMQRAQQWQNLLNVRTGYIQPRLVDGEFQSGVPPTSEWGFKEGNAVQYTWMIPYNLHTLFNALGGHQQVVDRLDTFFSQLNAGPDAPNAWLGNEPSFEAPWEYDFAGAPWRTQTTVRQAVSGLFNPTPDGLPGNDDLGAMSSWYVWAMLGFYPEIPGTDTLVMGSPLFSHVTLHLTNGHDVEIDATGAADNSPYVQSLDLNGQPYTKPWLPFSTLANGASLQFALGGAPNTAWGSLPTEAPPSFVEGEAPAIGSTSLDGALQVAAGDNGSFQLVIRNVTDNPQTVQWDASVPSFLSPDRSSGTMSVDGASSVTQTLSLQAAPGAPYGPTLISVRLRTLPPAQGEGSNAVACPTLTVAVFVGLPGPPTATPVSAPIVPTATTTALPIPSPSPTVLTAVATTVPPMPSPTALVATAPPTPTTTPIGVISATPISRIATATPGATMVTGRPVDGGASPTPTIRGQSHPSATPYTPTVPNAKRVKRDGRLATGLSLSVRVIHPVIHAGQIEILIVKSAAGARIRIEAAPRRGRAQSSIGIALVTDRHNSGHWNAMITTRSRMQPGSVGLVVVARLGKQHRQVTCLFRVIAARSHLPHHKRLHHIPGNARHHYIYPMRRRTDVSEIGHTLILLAWRGENAT